MLVKLSPCIPRISRKTNVATYISVSCVALREEPTHYNNLFLSIEWRSRRAECNGSWAPVYGLLALAPLYMVKITRPNRAKNFLPGCRLPPQSAANTLQVDNSFSFRFVRLSLSWQQDAPDIDLCRCGTSLSRHATLLVDCVPSKSSSRRFLLAI